MKHSEYLQKTFAAFSMWNEVDKWIKEGKVDMRALILKQEVFFHMQVPSQILSDMGRKKLTIQKDWPIGFSFLF